MIQTGYTARFDFEGKLLSRDVDIPTYKGLHHHGEEPEVNIISTFNKFKPLK